MDISASFKMRKQGAGGKRGFCWFQSQAGLAVQPMFGLGFRLRWLGSAMERSSVFGYGLAARARVLPVLVYVLTVLARVLTVFVYVLSVFVYFCPRVSMNLGESARIGKFGERHHRVFRHFLCLPIPIIILTAALGAVILHLSSTGL